MDEICEIIKEENGNDEQEKCIIAENGEEPAINDRRRNRRRRSKYRTRRKCGGQIVHTCPVCGHFLPVKMLRSIP